MRRTLTYREAIDRWGYNYGTLRHLHKRFGAGRGKLDAETFERYAEQKPSMREWRHPDLVFLRENWRTMTDAELAARLGRSRGGVEHKRLQLGYVRPKSLVGLRAQSAKRKAEAGKPYFTNLRGRRTKRILVRIGDKLVTMEFGRYVWMNTFGPVPDGMFVVRKPGRRGYKPDDLELVDRRELGRRGGKKVDPMRRSEAMKLVAERRRDQRRARVYLEHRPYEFNK